MQKYTNCKCRRHWVGICVGELILTQCTPRTYNKGLAGIMMGKTCPDNKAFNQKINNKVKKATLCSNNVIKEITRIMVLEQIVRFFVRVN